MFTLSASPSAASRQNEGRGDEKEENEDDSCQQACIGGGWGPHGLRLHIDRMARCECLTRRICDGQSDIVGACGRIRVSGGVIGRGCSITKAPGEAVGRCSAPDGGNKANTGSNDC